MLNLLVGKYSGSVVVNGQSFESVEAAYAKYKDSTETLQVSINHHSVKVTTEGNTATKAVNGSSRGDTVADNSEYTIKVRQYMTKHSTPDFDFMEKWNDNKPMPMRIMTGRVLEETKGMYKMELYAKPQPMSICMKCGRSLTHPVSLLYGIGPECGGHFHISPYSTKAELDANYEELKKKMGAVKWTGWVIKKAIEEIEKAKKAS